MVPASPMFFARSKGRKLQSLCLADFSFPDKQHSLVVLKSGDTLLLSSYFIRAGVDEIKEGYFKMMTVSLVWLFVCFSASSLFFDLAFR